MDDKTAPLFAYGKASAADKKKRIQIVDCVDQMQITPDGKVKVKGGAAGLRAWTRLVQALDKWPVDNSDPSKWGDKDVFVVDSLTEVAKGIALRNKILNNREDKPRYEFDDYSQVHKLVDGLLVTMKTYLKCPVVVIGHLQISGPDLSPGDIPGRGEDTDELKRQVITEKLNGAELIPWKLGIVTLGKAQAMKLGQHFDAAVYVKDTGGRGRRLFTTPTDGFDAGVPIPGIAAELPIDTGLATIIDGLNKLKRG